LAAVSVTVGYSVSTGAVTAQVSGLPSGPPVTATLTGPNGYSRSLAAGETVTNLAPGAYSLQGAPVAIGPDQYQPAAPVQILVTASLVPHAAVLQYALATGRLDVTIAGLPETAAASVEVTGPGGFVRTLGASELLAGLAPGTYTISAAEVTVSGVTYGVSGSLTVGVSASSTPAGANVKYAISRGSLSVAVIGLPQTVPASITVTGPQNYSRTLTAGELLSGLKPGTYTVSASAVSSGPHTWAPTPVTQQVGVSASLTPSQATVSHAIATGLLSVTVSGLPNGAAANLVVTGPAGYSQALTGSTLLSGLVPGSYSIAATPVQDGPTTWGPNPAAQSVNVPASTTAAQASVSYTIASGGLTVTITGLPVGQSASVRVTGPGGVDQTLAATQTLIGLLPGSYSLTASSVIVSGVTWVGTPGTQSVSVTAGTTAGATVTYAQSGGPPPPGVNLTIDGMHVQQVTQSYTGTVPLVAGKDGLLRVFVKASSTNTATPAVRVRFYQNATLTSTITIAAPGSSVPTTVSQATLAGSWNYLIPSALIVPGLRILADVDPTNAVSESSDSDNSFPATGTPLTMDVRSLSTFGIRFVPVTQSANGLTGGVTAGNAASYLAGAEKMFPLGPVDMDVRAPFTTSAPVLQNNDGNNAWSQILSELNALRAADGSSRFYAGIARVTYSSGIAGMGYVPGRATLSWDYLPSASGVVAHELGHNFGRFHAPCGGAGGPDPNYPYAGGQIGVYGYDLATATLKAPTMTDLMGYCSNNWISDYNYNAVMNYRIANPLILASSTFPGTGSARGLLVWGRVHRGQLVLEPAFEVDAPASLPRATGPHRLQAFGPLGETLIDLAFAGERPADAADSTEMHFAFVVPRSLLRGLEPSRLRLSSGGRVTERRSTSSAVQAAGARAEGSRSVRVEWSDPGVRAVLVRDARTGEILSFARQSDAVVMTSSRDLELTVSDGVRSARSRLQVRR
jgi:hypothetical protein